MTLLCEAVEPNGKTCSDCGHFKSMDEYSPGRGYRGGKRSQCNACKYATFCRWRDANRSKVRAYDRKAKLKSDYGISPEDFTAMWEAQGGLCASCETPLRRGKGGAAIDHCHTSGRVRSLLCCPCNTSLGAHKEDHKRIRKLADYAEFRCAA